MIFWLLKGEQRFNQLQRNLGGITHRTLAKTLREMEADGLVRRRITARSRRAWTIGLRHLALRSPPLCRRWSGGRSETISRHRRQNQSAKALLDDGLRRSLKPPRPV